MFIQQSGHSNTSIANVRKKKIYRSYKLCSFPLDFDTITLGILFARIRKWLSYTNTQLEKWHGSALSAINKSRNQIHYSKYVRMSNVFCTTSQLKKVFHKPGITPALYEPISLERSFTACTKIFYREYPKFRTVGGSKLTVVTNT